MTRTITNPANSSALDSSIIRTELQLLENEITAGADPGHTHTIYASSAEITTTVNSALASFTGSSNITTLGTIATGVWNGTVLTPAKGGTGIANGSNNTITITGNFTLGLTISGNTSITLPTTGTISTLAGTEELTNKTLNASVGKGTWTTSGTWTLPAITLGGVATLSENTSIALDPAGSADGKYSGITVTGIAGATIAFGDLITLDKDDSRWELVDISVAAAATGDARGVLGMAVSAGNDGDGITILLEGIIRADANFPTMTIGANVYASTTGDIVVTQPTTTDYVIRIVGAALTADEIFFRPDFTWITHT